MSISLVQPSLLLNSYAFTDLFGGCGMFMETTWNCPKNTRPKDIVNWILYVYNQTPNKHLHNVVLNFHGVSGEIYVGEASPESNYRGTYTPATYISIDPNNVGVFSALKGKNIGTIWIHSCSVAKGYKGKYLCRKMAEFAGCKVVAAEEDQEEWWPSINVIFMSRGSIDDYEGPVYLWDAKGNQGRFYPNGGNWS
jgi:hypothetical protein